ncbi:hypothetical protein BB559_001067 [Furculomyces boomerangus]|uniref:TRIP4/RQT4 C2HC5-type zinc finger domain-containing protein n=2 Tax=Harpellales TaxID=61421 RepID=A0A2T9Z344_9FUNG|nr:hypothetical protein BB559_001067 [Furculomyces boomerangus]PWA00314.1 hypothetical protein BB558_003625 [Smittium angustum]
MNHNSQINSYKITATSSIQKILKISETEAESIFERFLKINDRIELENELLEVLGFEENSLLFAAEFIQNIDLDVKSIQKNILDQNQNTLNKPKNLPRNSKVINSDYFGNSDMSRTESELTTKETPLSGNSTPLKDTIGGYRKEDNELVFFEGFNKGKKGKSLSRNESQKDVTLLNKTTSSQIEENLNDHVNHSIAGQKVKDINEQINSSTYGFKNESEMKPIIKKDNFKKSVEASSKSTIQDEKKKTNTKIKVVKPKKTREFCGCQSLEHKLLTNCIRCGHIICEKEGTGPCLVCNEKVDSRKQQLMVLIRNILEPEKLDTKNLDYTANKVYSILDLDGTVRLAQASVKVPKPLTNTKPVQFQPSRYSSKAGGTSFLKDKDWIAANETTDSDKIETLKSEISGAITRKKEFIDHDEIKNYLNNIDQNLKELDIRTENTIKEIKRLFEAENRKNRLLVLDANSAQTTKLIDEKADFDIDAVNKWLSTEERIENEDIINTQKKLVEDAEERLRKGVRVLKIDIDSKTISIEREEVPKMKSVETIRRSQGIKKGAVTESLNSVRESLSSNAKNIPNLKFISPPQKHEKSNKMKKQSGQNKEILRGPARILLNEK